MGDSIDIPMKEEAVEEPVTEAGPEVEIIEDSPVTEQKVESLEQVPPPVKRSWTGLKALVIVSILIGAAFGAFVLYQMSVPDINGVQILVTGENEDGDAVTVTLLVNTGFMSSYDGDVSVTVEYDDNETYETEFRVSDSFTIATIDYEDFYVDGGEYKFTAKVEGERSSTDYDVEKTAHSMYVNSPLGNNRSTTISQTQLSRYSVRTAFVLYSDASALHLMNLADIRGTGTVDLLESGNDTVIATSNIEIEPADVAEDSIIISNGNTESVVLDGWYVVDFNFNEVSWPQVDTTMYVRVTFTNTYPNSPGVILNEASSDGLIIRSY